MMQQHVGRRHDVEHLADSLDKPEADYEKAVSACC